MRTGLAGEPDAGEARWIEATVAGVRLASVYVPNGREVGSPTFAAKLAFLEAMAGAGGGARGRRRAMVAGDMNVCPTDADVYDPAAFVGSTHVTPEERERLGRVLAAGLVDAYRAAASRRRRASPGGTTARATSTAASACASTSPW